MHKTETTLMVYSDCCPDPDVHFYFHCTNARLRLEIAHRPLVVTVFSLSPLRLNTHPRFSQSALDEAVGYRERHSS
jgi:hypothetical protein